MRSPPLVLFTDFLNFDGSYNDQLWTAVESRAKEVGKPLVVCVGGRFDDRESGDLAQNFLYRLVLERPFGGLVVAHVTFTNLTDGEREALGRRLEGLPAVSTVLALGSVPVVASDSREGFRRLVRHLVLVHRKRRIVFVTGTPGLEVTLDRARIWVEEMVAAGLPWGSEWVVEGHFNPNHRPGLVAAVVQKIKDQGADAVVTSGDLVAALLVRELPSYGIKVPGQVSVTGFDGLPVSETLVPALTTVRQPLWEVFRTSVDVCLGLGTPGQPLEGQLVIRESCGCVSGTGLASLPDEVWRQSLGGAHEENRNLRSLVTELNVFAGKLGTLDGPGALGLLFEEWMPRLGLGAYFLSLACDEAGIPCAVQTDCGAFGPASPVWHRSWAQAPKASLNSSDGLVFAARDLAPRSWWDLVKSPSVVALPLARGPFWYGLVLFAVGEKGSPMFRAVQELTTSFLDRDYRLREEVRLNHEARLGAQLESEKARTLGRLLAGFSHDLATPFSVGRDSASFLVETAQDVGRAFEAGTLTTERLQTFIGDVRSLAGILDSNWTRAIDLVDRFKSVGTELPRDDLRRVDLASFLGDLIKTLEPMWRRRNVELTLDVPRSLEVHTRTAAFVDIVANLVQNAVVHGFPDASPGRIWVTARTEADRCRLEVADDGIGVPDHLRDRIFDPYMTTKEGEGGTGLGLAIVRERVQGLLAGTVVCLPRAGGGTLFAVEFPTILAQ